MKRIISLCCIALIFVALLPLSVSASESDVFTNFLDYNYVSGDSNSVTVTSSDFTIGIPAPFTTNWTYCDIILYSAHPFTVSNYSSELTVLPLGNYMYRVFGKLAGYHSDYLVLNFNFPSGYWQLYFYSVKCTSSSSFISSPVGFEATGFYPGGEFNLSKNFGDPRPTSITISNSDYSNRSYMLYLTPKNWKEYDFLEYQVYFDGASIDSISCVFGPDIVPLDVSYIYPSSSDSSYYVTFTLDLRTLDRSVDDYPMVIVSGNVKFDGVTLISLMNSIAYLFAEPLSEFLFFFNSLNGWIDSQTSSIESFFLSLSLSIDTHFSDLFNSIDTHFSDLSNSIDTHFSDLFNSIVFHTNALLDTIRERFSLLQSWLKSHFSDLDSWIQDQTDSLVSAIRGDTSPGDSFQQQVDQKDQEFEDMAAVMDSVDKPDIQDINVSVDNIVSPADVQLLATPMAVFFDGQIFSQMIVMSILLATVSFVLFGKR